MATQAAKHDSADLTPEQIDALQRLLAGVHQLADGRWIVATWDRARQQWISNDRGHVPESERASYCFSYGRTLEALTGIGIRTHRSRAAALRRAAAGNPWAEEVVDRAIRVRS